MMRWVIAIVFASACGSGSWAPADSVRALLNESAEARTRAPDLYARAQSALADAERAHASGQADAAGDELTRARLFAEAAVAEAARLHDEDERASIETRAGDILAQARRDEEARAVVGAELARLASARTAREEALRALRVAEQDEAQPNRRARASMGDPQEISRGAAALRARADLWITSAQALGAPGPQIASARAQLTAAEALRDPFAALDAADRAESNGLRLLGSTQAAQDPDAAASLIEAAHAEGFEVEALPHGLSIAVDIAAIRARAPRLAAILISHPQGPVQIEAAGSASRAQSVRTALVAQGVPADRLTAQALAPALHADPVRARVVLLAYSQAGISDGRAPGVH
jgi:colicin import membrane protein